MNNDNNKPGFLIVIEGIIALVSLGFMIYFAIVAFRFVDSCGDAVKEAEAKSEERKEAVDELTNDLLDAVDKIEGAALDAVDSIGDGLQKTGEAAYHGLEALDDALDEAQKALDEYQQNHGK